MEQPAPVERPQPWWRWLLLPLAPLLPLYLLFIIICLPVMYLAAQAQRRSRVQRLKRTMRRAGRVITWDTVERTLATGQPATLLLSSPSLGWMDTDLWWIPENIVAAAASDGVPAQKEPNLADVSLWAKACDFERWCQSRYLDDPHGTGKLVECTLSASALRTMRNRIATMKTRHASLEVIKVETWVLDAAARHSKHPVRP